MSLTPTNTQDGDTLPQVGFRNQRTWVLLASLETDRGTCLREVLAQRLWVETDTCYGTAGYRAKLRPLLSDLIHGDKKKGFIGIGEESLIIDPQTVQLKPGIVVTDIEEAEVLYRQAKALLDDNERLMLLRSVARQLQGSFLPGFEPPSIALPWYDTQILRLEELSGSVWNALLETAEKTGDAATKAEAWRQLQGLEMAETLENKVKPLTSRRSQRKGRSSPVGKWGVFASLLEQKQREGFLLSVSEEANLEDALEARVAQLPRPIVNVFRALSVFPQPFTRHQASTIAHVSADNIEETLHCLVKATLLREISPNPALEAEKRFCLLPFVAPLVFGNLHSQQRKRLRMRHAQHFFAFDDLGWPDPRRQKERIIRWFMEEKANYLQALDVCFEAPLTEETLTFIVSLRKGAAQAASDEHTLLQRIILRRAVPCLKEAIDAGQFFAYRPAHLLLAAATEEQNFSEAMAWANVLLEHIQLSAALPAFTERAAAKRDLVDALIPLLATIHHAGCHAEFDKAIEIAWKILPEIPDDEPYWYEMKIGLHRIIHNIKAENCWARGYLEAAYRANQVALEDLHFLVALDPVLKIGYPAAYYQRGCIQWERGHRDDALGDWNHALELFQEQQARHGIADCKRRIGRAFAEMGQYAIGLDLIREAIAIYTVQKKEASRIAAQGTLADVLVMRGKIEEARPLYEEGLAFSYATNHPDWIERFETSLQKLQPVEPNPVSDVAREA